MFGLVEVLGGGMTLGWDPVTLFATQMGAGGQPHQPGVGRPAGTGSTAHSATPRPCSAVTVNW